MSTRGAFGVRVDGQDKVAYNHFDSYPQGLGADLIAQVRGLLRKKGGVDSVRKLARNVRLIGNDGSSPTYDDKRALAPFCDMGVGEQSADDWYCLTRNLQGRLDACLKAGVMLDGREFLRDSLFCEWAYIVNLDDETFEVYEGFQKSPHGKGRYAVLPPNRDYYPVALVASWPLRKIPRNWIKRVLPDEEEDV